MRLGGAWTQTTSAGREADACQKEDEVGSDACGRRRARSHMKAAMPSISTSAPAGEARGRRSSKDSVSKSVEGVMEQLKLSPTPTKMHSHVMVAGDRRFGKAQLESCAGIVIAGLGTGKGARMHIGGVTAGPSSPSSSFLPLATVFSLFCHLW